MSKSRTLDDLARLGLRLGFGLGLAVAHGWPKLLRFGELRTTFADPLGIGSTASLSLAVFGELVCGLAVALGLLTRWSAVPASITMAVAFFLVHAGDAFRDRELSFVYLIGFLGVLALGPGRFSLDALLFKKKR